MVVVVRKPVDKPPDLMHHGIRGQKWGEKNGPPYPLDYQSHSSAEKKENPKLSIDGNPDTGKKRKGLNKETLAKIGKAALITAGVVAVGAVAYSVLESGKFDEILGGGRGFVEKAVSNTHGPLRAIPDEFREKAAEYGFKIKEELTEKTEAAFNSVCSRTNPSSNKSNCIAAAGTGVLERMGLDVVAKSFGNKSISPDTLKKVFVGLKYDNVISEAKSPLDAIEKAVNKLNVDMPEGSFGVLYGNSRIKDVSGHAILWEKLDGKIILGETQDGYKYDDVQEFYDNVGKNFNKDSVAFARADNCKVDFSQIWRIAKAL